MFRFYSLFKAKTVTIGARQKEEKRQNAESAETATGRRTWGRWAKCAAGAGVTPGGPDAKTTEAPVSRTRVASHSQPHLFLRDS